MSKTDIWYKWFPTDYEKDTMLLSDSEDLLYRRMLDFYFKNGGKFDEKALKSLPKVVRFSSKKFTKSWQKVSFFFPKKGTYFTNPKMDQVIQEAAARQRKNQINGAKGGRPNKPNGLPNGLSQPEPKQPIRASDSDSPYHVYVNNIDMDEPF